jgi:hypothetical protein
VAEVIYDTGALLAAEKQNPLMLELHSRFLNAGTRPLVPVVVLAQAWRGGPQPMLSRLLKGCLIHPDDERIGRAAGTACRNAGTSDVIDAIVAVSAASRGAVVVTSDPGDLGRLADGIGIRLRMFVV